VSTHGLFQRHLPKEEGGLFRDRLIDHYCPRRCDHNTLPLGQRWPDVRVTVSEWLYTPHIGKSLFEIRLNVCTIVSPIFNRMPTLTLPTLLTSSGPIGPMLARHRANVGSTSWLPSANCCRPTTDIGKICLASDRVWHSAPPIVHRQCRNRRQINTFSFNLILRIKTI